VFNRSPGWLPGGGFQFGHNNTIGSGAGWAAYNGDLTVSINITQGNNAGPSHHHNGTPLIFGSRTANSVVYLTGTFTFGDPITTTAVKRPGELFIVDNPLSEGDYAVMRRPVVSNHDLPLRKTGDGLLVFDGGLNPSGTWYPGETLVESGRLDLNCAMNASPYGNGITVYNGATLGGIGSALRAATVKAGGKITTGTKAGNIAGNLTVDALTLDEGAVLAYSMGGRIIVNGTATLPQSATVLLPPEATAAVVLVQATTFAVNTFDFSEWILPQDKQIRIDGNLLRCVNKPRGTLILMR